MCQYEMEYSNRQKNIFYGESPMGGILTTTRTQKYRKDLFLRKKKTQRNVKGELDSSTMIRARRERKSIKL